jgi:hypothetical protein
VVDSAAAADVAAAASSSAVAVDSAAAVDCEAAAYCEAAAGIAAVVAASRGSRMMQEDGYGVCSGGNEDDWCVRV